MSTQKDNDAPRSRWSAWLAHPAPVVAFFVILPCLVELTLIAADHGLIGSRLWRSLAYQNGAFWQGLLGNWQPNYAAQPVLMFFTYPFLHAGLVHLGGNMLVLLILGRVVVRQVGQARFVLLYVLSGIGGGLGLALLSDSVHPMVGASGALFGLVGAWKHRDWSTRTRRGLTRWPVIFDLIGLVILNAVFWVLEDGLLAWETHLGGFVTGWLFSLGWQGIARSVDSP
ncbi:rhomboid family intramembrane serine protease [Maritimibacter sp. 55A14]|uniref:rhomboid family intramembrane serine protease n=1 Tax=Maritimibacter sp. 55A14 TaxID=2174844 RepID=UPI000D608BC1|nr:rhomboid family intramembrane serine protease [Maritimibacter sp. 55A14]PWE33035.1 rhomboid family intramembrane serine protease [Maritimibacter sp. 55A14]